MTGRQRDKDYFRLDEAVNSIAAEIRRLEEDRTKLATALREDKRNLVLSLLSNRIISDVLEQDLFNIVKRTDLMGLRVAGIDGGVLARSYQNVDLILTRAVAAIFTYVSSGSLDVSYFPQETPIPKLISNLQPSSILDFELTTSIERITAELQLAIELQNYTKVDLIILDGSIVPQLIDRPPIHSRLAGRYKKVVELYESLYSMCISSGTLLAGVVEDSHSVRFMQILGRILPHLIEKIPSLRKLRDFDYRKVVEQTNDADFLNRILEPGERTPVFRYAETPSDYAAFSEFTNKTWADLVNVFYLRTVEFDRPIRVEYLGTESNKILTARRIASVIFPLSSHHAQYGIPSVLIEADARAHLIDGDIEIVYEQLIQKIGDPLILSKPRRERRPFW